MNQLATAGNPYQGDFKKVLCVCSAGILRSPTAAVVLSQPPFNCNTRAAGAYPEFALIPVTEALLVWADMIVCMEKRHMDQLYANFKGLTKPIYVLDIKDDYRYRDPELVTIIRTRFAECLEEPTIAEKVQ